MHQLPGNVAAGGTAAVDAQDVSLPLRAAAQVPQDVDGRGHIGEPRAVEKFRLRTAEERGRYDRKHRVF